MINDAFLRGKRRIIQTSMAFYNNMVQQTAKLNIC